MVLEIEEKVLKFLIIFSGGFQVTIEAETAAQAIQKVRELYPESGSWEITRITQVR
jgi:hypothetical protein